MKASESITEVQRFLIDRFLDAAWAERGLSRNTLASYRYDLQRLAISTGRGLQDELGMPGLDWRAQIRWMLQGRTFSRVIVEDVGDLAPFAEVAEVPTVHVGELLS